MPQADYNMRINLVLPRYIMDKLQSENPNSNKASILRSIIVEYANTRPTYEPFPLPTSGSREMAKPPVTEVRNPDSNGVGTDGTV